MALNGTTNGTDKSRLGQTIYRALPTLFFLCLLIGCSVRQETPSPPDKKNAVTDKLTISYGGPLPSLLAIAASQGLFASEGLDVTFKDLILGKNAFDDLLAGKSDYAVLAETPVVVQSFRRADFLILSTLRSTSNLSRIAVRSDRGITGATTLKGRRIATVKAVAPHYYLDLVLARNGLSEKDIVPVFLESDKLEAALLAGSVDAIAATRNIAQNAVKKLGQKGGLLENPGLCLNYSFLVTMKNHAATHPGQVDKFFRALRAAERFREQNPDKGREIVMALLKLSPEQFDIVWGDYTDKLVLDNALLLTLEEHAVWAMHKGFVTGQRIPNYLDYIDAGYLKKAAPDAVRLKR